GVPAAELTNRTVALEDLLGRGAHELVERLYDAGSWERRFALLDAVIARRLSAAAPPPSAVDLVWQRLTETRGRTEIGALRRETGWSARHLATSFRREVGLAPKTYARVLRFEHAVERLGRDDGSRIAE